MHSKKPVGSILSLSSLLILISLAPALGQSEDLLVVKIPFPFGVSNATLPAGEYTVDRLGYLNGGLLIRRVDGRHSKLFLAMSDSYRSSEADKGNFLVFHRYGDQYFLSQVQNGATHTQYELLPSRAERQAAKNASQPPLQLVSLTAARP